MLRAVKTIGHRHLQIMTRNKKCAILILVTLFLLTVYISCECLYVKTSLGNITLRNGQKACVPLHGNETEHEKGKKFVICINDNISVRVCPLGLRFDVRSGTCDKRESATCGYTEATVTTGKVTTTLRPVNTPSTQLSPRGPSKPPPEGLCNTTNCKLPDCFCVGHRPSNNTLADLPMFVMISFDDHVSTVWYNKYYQDLMVDNKYKLLNPSGLRPKFTFYVNHDNTDYTKVKALWEAGHEIGSHTFHHRLPQGDVDSDYPKVVAEVDGLKNEILKATGNKTLVDSIRGFRAPYLRVAGDVQFDVLRDRGFLYDTSILNNNIHRGKEPHWPFTLDFVIGECTVPPCATKPYPGLWEVPLNGWIGDDGRPCSMADNCIVGLGCKLATDQEWYNFYKY